jgi:hypothetical protein
LECGQGLSREPRAHWLSPTRNISFFLGTTHRFPFLSTAEFCDAHGVRSLPNCRAHLSTMRRHLISSTAAAQQPLDQMAASDSSSSGADQLPFKKEDETITITTRHRIPRRKLTLGAITLLLNIILWSSMICLITAAIQIASVPNVAGVFTLTSVSHPDLGRLRRKLTCAGIGNTTIYSPAYDHLREAAGMGQPETTPARRREDVSHCCSRRHRSMRLLALDLWLEHDRRCAKAYMPARWTWSKSVGGWDDLPHIPAWRGLCYDCIVSISSS